MRALADTTVYSCAVWRLASSAIRALERERGRRAARRSSARGRGVIFAFARLPPSCVGQPAAHQSPPLLRRSPTTRRASLRSRGPSAWASGRWRWTSTSRGIRLMRDAPCGPPGVPARHQPPHTRSPNPPAAHCLIVQTLASRRPLKSAIIQKLKETSL